MATRHTLPAAPPNTASIYVRLSKLAGDENLSKDGMVEDCVKACLPDNLTPIAIHIDDGISGAVRNRPEFTAWLDDARECRASTLVTWHVDRLTREGINVAALIMDTIEGKDPETGKPVRAEARLIDTKGLDSAGDETTFRFRFVIAAELARGERVRMIDRSRARHRRSRESGRWSGGVIPYGFRPVKATNGKGLVLEQHPEEARAVREAADRILSGASWGAVTRWLNSSEGYPPRRADAWSSTTVRKILTGGPQAGYLVKTVNGQKRPVVDANGDIVTVPAILTPDESATIRAMVDEAAERRLQELGRSFSDHTTGGRHSTRWLSGVATCASCGRLLAFSQAHNGGRGMYFCRNDSNGGCPHPPYVASARLEEHVESTFLGTFGDRPEYLKRREVSGAAEISAAEEAVTTAIAALSEAATAEAFKALQNAQARREAALNAPRVLNERVVETGRTMREAWEATAENPEARRDLLRANYAAIAVRRSAPDNHGSKVWDPRRVTMVANSPVVVGLTEHTYRHGIAVVNVEEETAAS
ncbi:DNA invertase Pin-like site-specific DNA recombinase [Kibdelosporangium banguiense]|uniref:DNA invertase Pin-like site-specific DNA recombinase n=1 Tax=Kibdelosporangium banguiense TaxID=1365924 RepID=A0ABS4TGC5_9PSEU|nr:recombinase family protein [Kibdelosporangium banguiense]MBP2323376.1 DNA invertase Pin-like site-specific DNA recombinase [Kibdelosporangium banguiense]